MAGLSRDDDLEALAWRRNWLEEIRVGGCSVLDDRDGALSSVEASPSSSFARWNASYREPACFK